MTVRLATTRPQRAIILLGAFALAVELILSLGARPAGDWVRPIFGFDSQIGSTDDATLEDGMSMMQAAGSTWTRTGFYWPHMDRRVRWPEDVAEKRDWARSDRHIASALRHRQQLIGALIGSASWASQGAHPWKVPEDPKLFGQFAFDVVSRYKDRVHIWEIWNEPNNGMFDRAGPDPVRYARLLRTAYLSIKRADPEAKVVLGPLFRNDMPFLEKVYAATEAYPEYTENRHFFDLLGVHPYPGDRPPESADPRLVIKGVDRNFSGLVKMKASMERHGEPDKHIIVSEVAWAAYDTWWVDGVGLERQADYLARAYRMAERWPWLDAMCWYGFVGPDREEIPFSLVEPDLTPRPSYFSYMRTARGWD